jgi:hypothetical protein
MRDGVAGAVLKGASGAVAVIVASVVVGRLAGQRGVSKRAGAPNPPASRCVRRAVTPPDIR